MGKGYWTQSGWMDEDWLAGYNRALDKGRGDEYLADSTKKYGPDKSGEVKNTMTKLNGPACAAIIVGIWGHEPKREGEFPLAYLVGLPCGTHGDGEAITSRIAYREVDYGDHRLGFFDIFIMVDGDERQIASVAARAIAEIHYAQG